MNQHNIPLGAKLSPKDTRNFKCGSAVEIDSSIILPESFSVWQPEKIKDQGEVGSCVAHAMTNILECIDHLQGDNSYKEYSIGGIYGLSDTWGMYPNEACKGVLKEGDVFQKIWECFKENPTCHNERAKVWHDLSGDIRKKVFSYIEINTEEELMHFMYKYKLPVMIIAKGKVFSPFCSDGYHAVSCYGWISKEDFYKKNSSRMEYKKFLYTNSWGQGGVFGDGRGYIDFKNLEEIWGLVPMGEKKFTDVADEKWYAAAIKKVSDAGIMNGYTDGSFQPEKQITRAEIAQVCANMITFIEKNSK